MATLVGYLRLFSLAMALVCLWSRVESQRLFRPNEDVILLNTENFKSKVLPSQALWLIMLSSDDSFTEIDSDAPWNEQCKKFAPRWSRAATCLKGMAKFAALDIEADDLIGQIYKIESVPTIKIFGSNKYEPLNYSGNMTVRAFIDEAIEQLRAIVVDRLNNEHSSTNYDESDLHLNDNLDYTFIDEL